MFEEMNHALDNSSEAEDVRAELRRLTDVHELEVDPASEVAVMDDFRRDLRALQYRSRYQSQEPPPGPSQRSDETPSRGCLPLESLYELSRRHSQPLRQPQHGGYRGHSVPPLDVRDERRMEPGRLGQGLLRKPQLQPDLTHPLAEGHRDGQVSGALARRHNRASHRTPLPEHHSLLIRFVRIPGAADALGPTAGGEVVP